MVPKADSITGASVDLTLWSIIETGTYIITVCLPELKPLVSKCFGTNATTNSIEMTPSSRMSTRYIEVSGQTSCQGHASFNTKTASSSTKTQFSSKNSAITRPSETFFRKSDLD